MATIIGITGLSKAAVLAALFNAAKPVGLGALHHNADQRISEEEAAEVLQGHTPATPYTGQPMRVDWLHGRPIHIDFSGDTINVEQYERTAGKGTAAREVARLCGQAVTVTEELEGGDRRHTSYFPNGTVDEFYESAGTGGYYE